MSRIFPTLGPGLVGLLVALALFGCGDPKRSVSVSLDFAVPKEVTEAGSANLGPSVKFLTDFNQLKDFIGSPEFAGALKDKAGRRNAAILVAAHVGDLRDPFQLTIAATSEEDVRRLTAAIPEVVRDFTAANRIGLTLVAVEERGAPTPKP